MVIHAQFEAGGKIGIEFKDYDIHLLEINNYHKITHNNPNQIIKTVKIDSLGEFLFKDLLLSKEDKFYKIYFDSCNKEHSLQHLNSSCSEKQTYLFIANSQSSLYLPLNEFGQSFCIPDSQKKQNILFSIDSVNQQLDYNILDTQSEIERKRLYKKGFQTLQQYSRNSDIPLAQLYAYSLYSNPNSYYYPIYHKNLKNNRLYYDDLLEKLENTPYHNQLLKSLEPKNQPSNTNLNSWIYLFLLLLMVVVILLLFYIRNLKKSIHKLQNQLDQNTLITIDNLTPQEQKIIELIIQKKTNKEIANELFISVSTVKTHINNIYSKLGITDRKELIDQFSKNTSGV